MENIPLPSIDTTKDSLAPEAEHDILNFGDGRRVLTADGEAVEVTIDFSGLAAPVDADIFNANLDNAVMQDIQYAGVKVEAPEANEQITPIMSWSADVEISQSPVDLNETLNAAMDEHIAADNLYACECGLLVGEHNTGRICHACGTVCKHPDIPLPEHEPINDTMLTPIRDYMTFEQYLNTMRETHGYEKFDAKQALEFDNAVTYRWRDIRALRLVMQNMGIKSTNPLQRFTSEYRRVYSNMEFIYLEMANLRQFLMLEIQNLNEQAKRAKKEKKTMLGTILSTTASRIQKYTAMGSRIPISMELKETAKVGYFWQRQYQTINDGLRSQLTAQTVKLKQLSDIQEPSLEVLEMITWLQHSVRDLQTTLENSHSVLQTASEEFDKESEDVE